MKISMNELLCCISSALDIVEGELLGATTNHGKRIAVLSAEMGRYLGLSDEELIVLSAGALLHDNALTEYILSERPGDEQDLNLVLHCIYGQRNADSLPFPADFEGCVLYHHERPDGQGPFGKKLGEFPLSAAIVAAADHLDANYQLQNRTPEELPGLHKIIDDNAGIVYTQEAADSLKAVLTKEMLLSILDETVLETYYATVPLWDVDIDDEAIIRLAGITAQIIDYKSRYTRKHSILAANTCWWMAQKYGIDHETRAQIYLAAALHDLGKLNLATSVLEKPGQLTDNEYTAVKEHCELAYDLLQGVQGLENICEWIVCHHEKLNGSGYPFGKKEKELPFVAKLLTCVDVYHAVSEERPYHPARSHEDTMPILYDMVQRGELDADIVKALDEELAKYPNGAVPAPPGAVANAWDDEENIAL